MTNLRKQIYNYIEENNNDNKISSSSIKTYTSYITKLYKQFNNNDEFEPEFFLTDYKNIIKHIDDYKNLNSKKSYISSILFLLRPFEDEHKKKIYLDYLLKIGKLINDSKLEQKKNIKEEKNWIEPNQIKIKYEELYKNYNELLKIKNISIKDYQNLQDLIIISLYYLNKPRRLKDFTEMKYYNYDKEKDNYIDLKKNQFIFNDFKTKKYFINNKVDIDNNLSILLREFIKLKKRNKNLNRVYLLEGLTNNKLKTSNLNKRLNNIFDNKNISVNILRKSYLSNIYENIPALKIINNISNDMANSLNEQLLSYVKK